MFKIQYRLTAPRQPQSIADYRRAARRALPDMVWAYVDSGAEDLISLRANEDAFRRWYVRQRILTGRFPTDLTTTIAGTDLSLPLLLAPTGMTGMSHWTGERGAAQAAEAAGTRAVLSTAASYTPEEIGAATTQNHFFQLYPWADESGDHTLTKSIIDRARAAGFSALFLTVDVQVHGNRETERRRGMGLPPVLTPRRILDAARRPAWWYPFIKHRRIGARLLVDEAGAKAALRSAATQFKLMRPELDWSDFEWVRQEWSGPLYVKGLLDPDDAAKAVDLGADGVVVSNHGGRQLDSALSSLDALPAIADRVGDRAQVLLDGGVRRGTDVVKALCLGADAVLVGRPYVYGLAARGPAGVSHVLDIFREEIERTMTLMGAGSLDELDRSWLIPAADHTMPALEGRR